MRERLTPRWMPWQRIPFKLRTLEDVLNPQPAATIVYKHLLGWIHRVAEAARIGMPRPAFATEDGALIFPEGDDHWWLTDVQLRAAKKATPGPHGDEDGPAGNSSGEDPVADAGTQMDKDFAVTDSDPEDTDEDNELRHPHADDTYNHQPYVEHASGHNAAPDLVASAARSAIRDRAVLLGCDQPTVSCG